ncbi:MAG: hypothetical protein OHK0056_25150 [Bacteriovoracaceae bacterium]
MRRITLPLYMYLMLDPRFHFMAIGIVISGYALAFKWALESLPKMKAIFAQLRTIKWLPKPIAIRLPEIILNDLIEVIVFIGLLKIKLS